MAARLSVLMITLNRGATDSEPDICAQLASTSAGTRRGCNFARPGESPPRSAAGNIASSPFRKVYASAKASLPTRRRSMKPTATNMISDGLIVFSVAALALIELTAAVVSLTGIKRIQAAVIGIVLRRQNGRLQRYRCEPDGERNRAHQLLLALLTRHLVSPNLQNTQWPARYSSNTRCGPTPPSMEPHRRLIRYRQR